MGLETPTPDENPLPAFDIVSTYRSILDADSDLTMPVAAIEALVEAIAHSSVSTVAETLKLLERLTEILKASIANPISLSAGTDLFQRYLITTLNRPASLGVGPSDDFRAVRNHLLTNGRLFVERAKASREKIASFGKHFIRDGATVLTNGGSRVVGALLRRAAESSTLRFKVIYVLSPSASSDSKEGLQTVADLRAHNVPVATIPDSAVAYSLGKVDMVIVGAEGVVENGGIISRLGTYQLGLLAKSKGKPFYVVAESHKFVRLYPLSQFDLPIEQKVLDFKVSGDDKADDKVNEDEAVVDMNTKESGSSKCSGRNPDDAVDFTPPDLISGIITESGVLTPSAVSEELIKIWHVPDPDCDHLHRFKDELEGDPIGRVWDGEVLEGWVQRPKGEAVAAHDMKTNGQKRHSKCGLDVANATLFQDCQERDTLTNESYIA